jgi:hypothetical protein
MSQKERERPAKREGSARFMCQKRPTCVKRDLHVSKETCMCQKRPTCVKRDCCQCERAWTIYEEEDTCVSYE